MPDKLPDMTLAEKANAAFLRVAAVVIERARRTGTPVVLWENGRVVHRSPDELTVPREGDGRDPLSER
jgi:hypothetical protein